MEKAPNISKERLLRAVIAYVADHGVTDLSLRALAAAIGTSHRMLIYHFGSKEGLLIEVIRSVEDQQRQILAELDVDPSLSPTEVTRRMWQHLSEPALWPNERLFFETYGQALQARPHTAHFLDDIVESWLEPGAALRSAQGVHGGAARAQARLDLAVTRGLLLDLLATGDRAGANAAVEQYLALFEAWRALAPDRGAAAARTATRSVESGADPDAVFALLADPRHLPDWAPGFADAVEGSAGSGWRVTKDGRDFDVRVVATPGVRTVDYLREVAPGREGGAALRVMPRPGGGSVVVMTLPVAAGVDPVSVAAIAHDELVALVALVGG